MMMSHTQVTEAARDLAAPYLMSGHVPSMVAVEGANVTSGVNRGVQVELVERGPVEVKGAARPILMFLAQRLPGTTYGT